MTAVNGVDAGRGLAWWSEAWTLFMRAPWLWLAMTLLVVLGFVLVSFVPLLGTLAVSLGLPAVAGGWMLAADKQQRGESVDVGDLFAPFQRSDLLTPLLVQGAVVAVASLVVFGAALLLGAGAVLGMMTGGVGGHHGAGSVLAAAGMGLAALLVLLLLGLVMAAALWFAPSLVVFQQTPPIDALRLSLVAVARNVLPFLVYGLVQLVLAVVASIPFGLGWLVFMPVALLTAYTSYRDVFGPPAG